VNGYIDATALLRAGGQVPIPVTEVFVELRRTSDSSVAFSRLLTGSEIDQAATTLQVRIRVELHQSPEDFYLVLQARGGGFTPAARSPMGARGVQRVLVPKTDPLTRNTSAPARAGWTASYSRFQSVHSGRWYHVATASVYVTMP
jgi:hypothetical protein